MSTWQDISSAPEGVEVLTKIHDDHGERNVQTLIKRTRIPGETSSLWWMPDGSMYVYYSPTHWQSVSRASPHLQIHGERIMGKPGDIPQGVWLAAGRALSDHAYNPLRVEPIARAIMAAIAAEREACAAVADEYVWDAHALAQATPLGIAIHQQSVEIAAAIRERSEG